MYVWPALLPPVSNREDLILTVSLFDDDTGQAIKLDGCTTASLLPFSGSAWTVTDGAIITTSTTPLTIPVFPIVASLAAVALTVGVGLAITAGDPILIADTATGLNTMRGFVASYTPSTGALVVQIGCTFLLEIRRGGPRNDGGYVPWYDLGLPNSCSPLISAKIGTGIAIVDIGVIQVTVSASKLAQLYGGTYSASLIVCDGVSTRQMFAGELPVIWGGVTVNGLSVVAS